MMAACYTGFFIPKTDNSSHKADGMIIRKRPVDLAMPEAFGFGVGGMMAHPGGTASATLAYKRAAIGSGTLGRTILPRCN
jgi:hypothetical protein